MTDELTAADIERYFRILAGLSEWESFVKAPPGVASGTMLGGDADAGFRDDAGVREILASGEFTFEFSPPDLRTLQYAALKSAYLAACNLFGHLPQSASAERIRRDLVLARTTSLRDELPASVDAERMRLYKTFRPPTERPLALMKAPRDGDEPQEFLISLAGTVIVSWPFSDLSPVVPR